MQEQCGATCLPCAAMYGQRVSMHAQYVVIYAQYAAVYEQCEAMHVQCAAMHVVQSMMAGMRVHRQVRAGRARYLAAESLL